MLILNVMGVGLGPYLFGVVSDHLTATHGQEALRYAIVLCGAVLYLAAALMYFIESRFLGSARVKIA